MREVDTKHIQPAKVNEPKKAIGEIEEFVKFPSENPNPVLRISKDGIVIYHNNASGPLLEQWQYKEGEPLPDRWCRIVLDTLEEHDIRTVETEMGDKTLSLIFTPIINKDFINVYGLDITGRKHAEDELRQYAHIVSTSTDMMALLDDRYIYRAANKTYLEAFELSQNDLIGHTVSEVFGVTFFEEVIKPNAERCMTGQEINYQEWFDFPAYPPRYMDITYYPYRGQDDEIKGFVVSARNITDRKEVEEALQESQSHLVSFMDSASDSFYLLDPELNFLEINRRGLEIIGKPKEDVIGSNLSDIVPDVKESGRYDRHLEVLRTGEPFIVEDFIPHPVFGDRHFLLKSFKAGDNLGVIASDITDRKLAEENLQRSKQELQRTLDATTDGIWTWNFKKDILTFSPKYYGSSPNLGKGYSAVLASNMFGENIEPKTAQL